jgi:outer membrane protein OmpA-like peptidoglycan-associated protein
MRMGAVSHREAGRDQPWRNKPPRSSNASPAVAISAAPREVLHPSMLLHLQAKAGNSSVASLFAPRVPVQRPVSMQRKECCTSCLVGQPCHADQGEEPAEVKDATTGGSLAVQRTTGNKAIGALLPRSDVPEALVQRRGGGDCGYSPEDPSHGQSEASSAGFLRDQVTIQRACGGAEIGSRTGCIGSSEEQSDFEFAPYRFNRNCDTFKPGEKERLELDGSVAVEAGETLEVHGFASSEGNPQYNVDLSCARADQVASVLGDVGAIVAEIHAHGPTPGNRDLRRSVTLRQAPPRPGPGPVPPPPAVCPTVPTARPGTCSGRNGAYCEAASCKPSNPWLSCVCTASGQVCEAVDAFAFDGARGTMLAACAALSGAPGAPIIDKSNWFLSTNRCIWDHWRAAFDAIHNPSIPIPAGLTPEWAAAVATCRASGLSSNDCCNAHVKAEQTAIDACGPYDSVKFGPRPTDVPGAPGCSSIVAALAPGLPFTGDFGKVADRITYGNTRCCP